jgi:nucleoside-diphosphate-sugar epimerase
MRSLLHLPCSEVSKRVVVDGANGYVGSNFVHELLRSQHDVVALTRSDPQATQQAVGDAVVNRGGRDLDLGELKILPYTLERPDLGLDGDALDTVFGAPCDYWHFAASVKLSVRTSEEVFRTNVDGTRNTLAAFAENAPPGSRYFLISTAYTCGHQQECVLETWHDPAPLFAFRNYYEATKRWAELIFREYQLTAGVKGAALRLGQIVGDSVTGKTTTSYGLYDFISGIGRVARRRPNSHVRILGDPSATLHLVPVDACVSWLTAVMGCDLDYFSPPVFHILDSSPVSAHAITMVLRRHLPINIEIAAECEVQERPLSALERAIAARMSLTATYIQHPFNFSRLNLPRIVGPSEPVVDEAVLDRLIGTFVGTRRETSAC